MTKTKGFAILLLLVTGLSAFAFDVEAKYQEYVNTDALISPARAQHIMNTEENVVVVDVRQAEHFEEGHIPGAVNVWRPQYGASGGEWEYRGMRAAPEKLYATLGSLGIQPDSRIIFYSNSHGYDAFRLAWLITMYGHEKSKVHVIDGYFPAWKEAGLPVSTTIRAVDPTTYVPQNMVDLSRLAGVEDVEKALDDTTVVILDTRTPEEWWGIAQYTGAYRKGHIPGAVHLNYTENYTGEGIKSIGELKAIYEKAGITPDKTIIAYCQSGVRSSKTTFVLTELLGYPNVKNYDGSWVEWSYYRDQSVTAPFLYLVSAVMLILIAGAVSYHIIRKKKEKKSFFNKVAIGLGVVYVVFLMWFFNLFSLISMDGIKQLQMWIESFGILGPVVYLALFAAGCLFFLPGTPFAIVAAIVFGPVMGTVWASIGSTIGASLAFLAGRYAFRGFAEKLIEKNPSLKKIDDGVKKNGWRMLMITRFVPVFPFNVQNYVYGLTNIPFVTYVLLSWLFMIPGTMAYVFIAGAAVSGANLTTIMTYFAIGAILLVGLSFLPKILKKKAGVADLIEEEDKKEKDKGK